MNSPSTLQGVLPGSSSSGSVVADAAHVSQWSVHEVALTAARDYGNPYTEVAVTAHFTGPNGATTTVRGFWDGGRDFKVRFCPTAKGRWTYSIRSSPADGGLANSGSFTVAAPQPGHHGFLRSDAEHPTSFVFDDGTRCFMLGTTYYAMVGNARASERWRESITNLTRYGINKARMYLDASDMTAKDRPRPIFHPPSSPFADRAAERLDIDHWRAADRVVRFMGEQALLADLIVFPYRRTAAAVGTLAQDERYLCYVLARYGAFPNILWCLVNEWNYSVLPPEYWDAMGRLARSEDPWARAGDNLRALTLHQQTRPDWQFPDATWPSHANLQFGVRNLGTATKVGGEWQQPPDGAGVFKHGDEWGNYSIARNRTGTHPVVNDEFGYIGEPVDQSEGKQPDGNYPRLTREKHRNALWGIVVGGGYAAAGDKNDYADGRPYMSANWHDVPEYADIKHLADFFTARGLEYWKMAPHNEVITSGARVYALAEPGRRYAIYAAAGGAFTVALPAGDYAAWRFDPRTGAEVSLPELTGGTSHTFSCPDPQDWVFRLSIVP